MFLIREDFDKFKNASELTVMLTESGYDSTDILNQSIDFAVEYIKSKLQQRYDADQIFLNVNIYDTSATYAVNDIVEYENKIYTCIKESTGNLPTVGEFFEQKDIRNSLIKNYAIMIALKHLYLRVQPRVIPEWIMDEADKAQTHLDRISSGKDTVLLPIYEDADKGQNIVYGSETQKNWNF